MKRLGEIASLIDGELRGNKNIAIYGIKGLVEAQEGDIACLIDPKYRKYLPKTRASALVVGKDVEEEALEQRNVIIVNDPQTAFIKLLLIFEEKIEKKGKMDPVYLSENVHLGSNVTIYPFVYVGSESEIGDNVTIYPFVFIGNRVKIGEECTIYPNVSIYDGTVIGKRVSIHAGTVVGSDGFGYFFDGKNHVKIPQIGNVIIEDDVEIGANVTIDRATLGSTVIKRGTKIDNLVQIAHNVEIGDNSIIVAQVGIAGSVKIGKNVILAGQVGIRDHVTIGDNVRVSGKTGITKDVKEGEIVSGNPHMPHQEWKRLQFFIKKLPSLFERVKELEKSIKEKKV